MLENWKSGTLGLVINNMNCGGAERVLSLLANGWAERGQKIVLFTTGKAEPSFFPLSDKVTYCPLNLGFKSANVFQAWINNRKTVRTLVQKFKEYQIITVIAFATRTNMRVFKAAKQCGIPAILSERNDPSRKDLSPLIHWFKDRTYRKADHLVVQSRGSLEYYQNMGVTRVTLIPNPLEPASGFEPAVEPKRILSVGRMHPQKGHDLLLESFSLFLKQSKNKNWILTILGDGPLRGELLHKAKVLGLEQNIDFPGIIKDKVPFYRETAVFALSSRFEGFPNVLAEAMSAGLPCVSFDCSGGVRDLVQDGKNGILVPPGDVEKMAHAFLTLTQNRTWAKELGQAAVLSVNQYGLGSILTQWDSALDRAWRKKYEGGPL